MNWKENKKTNSPDVFSFSIRICDYPMPSEKLNRTIRVIGNSYSICKKVLPLQRLTAALNVHTSNLNPYPLKNHHMPKTGPSRIQKGL